MKVDGDQVWAEAGDTTPMRVSIAAGYHVELIDSKGSVVYARRDYFHVDVSLGFEHVCDSCPLGIFLRPRAYRCFLAVGSVSLIELTTSLLEKDGGLIAGPSTSSGPACTGAVSGQDRPSIKRAAASPIIGDIH
ncbi:MAG: hypothetical protein R3C28_28550 [Pirellulaceae bacterium]